MKPSRDGRQDGGLERCADCGHPAREHRGEIGCTVPNCGCESHKLREMLQPRKKGSKAASG